MKKFALLLCAPALLVAQETAQATAPVSARIVAPLKIASTQNLNFGAIVVKDLRDWTVVKMDFAGDKGWSDWVGTGHANNTVKDPQATISYGDNAIKYKHSEAYQPAKFVVDGDAWAWSTRGVGLDVSSVVDMGRGVTLYVDTDLPAEDYTPLMEGMRRKGFQVAGRVVVPAGVVGLHTGTITATVNYL